LSRASRAATPHTGALNNWPGPSCNDSAGPAEQAAADDIASFAIAGGVIIYGVAEQTAGPPLLHPIPLAGLSERLEGIARTRISEPLSIRTTPLPAAAGAGLGYLMVHVPMSPRAPHMVGGKYYGRDENPKRELTNEDVVRLLERRLAAMQAEYPRC
jgi:hypothetical protein